MCDLCYKSSSHLNGLPDSQAYTHIDDQLDEWVCIDPLLTLFGTDREQSLLLNLLLPCFLGDLTPEM